MWFDVYFFFEFLIIATRNKYKYKKFYFKSDIYISNNISYNELFTNIYVVVLCLLFVFMLSCYIYFLHLCCYAMLIILHLCCYPMFIFLHSCCYAIFIFWIYVFMLCFFYFIVACTPMPACPVNYQRIGIPAGVAGAVLQSCYRVLPAPNPAENFLAATVSIYTCRKLCWGISMYMYLL